MANVDKLAHDVLLAEVGTARKVKGKRVNPPVLKWAGWATAAIMAAAVGCLRRDLSRTHCRSLVNKVVSNLRDNLRISHLIGCFDTHYADTEVTHLQAFC